MADKTLADLLVLNDARNAPRNISDVLNDALALKVIPADTVLNTVHYFTKHTTDPTVGFRAENDGRILSKSVDEQVTVTLKILDASFRCDKAIADAFKGGPEAYIAKEAARHLKAAMFLAERQLWYGNNSPGNTSGCEGLLDEVELNQTDGTMVVNAGGTLADLSSSLWAVRASLDDVAVIVGQNGQLSIADSVVQEVAGNTGTYPVYYTPMSAWLAFQRGSAYSAGRVCNLTTETNKGLTDDVIASLLAKFPAAKMPTHLFCSRRSRLQLQQSRTATNATGAPAPFPTEAFGIPLIATDSIVDTEPVEQTS
jgi:hypothetical protein